MSDRIHEHRQNAYRARRERESRVEPPVGDRLRCIGCGRAIQWLASTYGRMGGVGFEHGLHADDEVMGVAIATVHGVAACPRCLEARRGELAEAVLDPNTPVWDPAEAFS